MVASDPSRTRKVRRALAAAWVAGLVYAAAPGAVAAQTGDTVRVENRATATFRTDDGFEGSAEAAVTVVVKFTAGVRISAPQTAALVPGARRVFAHRLENMGNGADRFTLAASAPQGWVVRLFVDTDGDGVLGEADAAVSGALPLGARESAALLLVVDVPADAPDVASAALDVRATSSVNPALADAVRDMVSVRRPVAALSLGKSVDRTDATPGDTLLYTLSYANRGDAASGAAEVVDTLSSALQVVAGSVTINGQALTDAADGDAGSVQATEAGRQVVRVNAGVVEPGASGTIFFRAVVGAGAASVANGASMTTERLAYTPPLVAVSPVVETQLVRPEIALAKERLGADTVRVGGEVEYLLTWTNKSAAVAARGLVLEDTLPAGLQFVRADREPEVSGQVLRWTLGLVNAGETGSVRVTVRVTARPEDGPVVNRAVLAGANATAVAAESAPLRALGFTGDEISVKKTAGVLEAAMGEAVPYSVAVENRATVALRGVQVVDFLPAGMKFVEGRLTGADSARVEGNTLRIFLGEVAPLSTRTVGYLVTVVSPGAARALENRAMATAEGGALNSDTASAWVRMRGGFALQVRTLVGKVWVDTNGNGRQESGERGVPGVDVWSADGEVVTTDREGRYSFRDVRVGTHAVRVDTVGIPANLGFARPADAIARVRMEGWTTPRVDFRLVPRAGPASLTVAAPNAPAEHTGAGPAAPAAPAVEVKDSTPRAARIAPARTEETRKAADASSFATGPSVKFFAPGDGSVIATNRLFVGVKGEPGAAVRLFDGDSAIAEATLRPDGVADFIGVQVGAGPHRLRVEMKNSWGQQRADTLALHVSGGAERFEVGDVPALHAGAPRADTVRVRVLDTWGVPTSGGVAVTVESTGAETLGADQDGGSAGQQLRADSAGWLAVPLRPGHVVGPGELRLAAGKATASIPLRVLPSTRPLIATGVGQVGVGAAPGAFGAVTVRGSVARETTVSVSFDSRRGQEGDDFFGRGYDPGDESRYPTLGDGSERRVLSSSTQKVSARVERGFDWVQLGDVETGDFGGDPRLGTYGRALTGVTGRVSTGAVTWRGFGSVTDQVLAQRQARGNGTSGPYRFGGSVRPGTDRVAIEVRARENAARVISRLELARWNDYQIDYATGEVLLQRPVPSTDQAGNPVFVVAMLESRSGGEARFVGGARMEVDAARVLGIRGAAGDSLAFSVMGVRDGGEPTSGFGGQDLLGTGLRVRHGGLTLRGEMLRSQRPDSVAYAGRAEASWTLFRDRARIGAEWLKVGAGFAPGTDPRLSAGVQELRAIGELKVTDANTLNLSHDRQRFDGYGMERASTMLRSRNRLAGRALVTEAGMTSDDDGSGTASSALGKMTLSVTPRADLWVEGTRVLSDRRPLAGAGALTSRPDQMGLGASYRVFGNTRVEGSHRWVTTRGDSAGSYGLSSVNLRTDAILGGQMWGGLERADAERASHSAVLGWNQRLSLTGGWSLNVLGERHFGLNRAALLDPTRALPFARQERDRWSAGAGIEYLPTDSALRFSARSEVHGGVEAQGYRIDVAGDLPIGASAALLTRHDWWQDNRNTGQGMQLARRDRSLLGLAMRPAQHNDLNVLAKLEWRNTINPFQAAGGLGSSAVQDRRLIGAADALWAARPGTELGARYAVRWASRADSASALGTVSNLAHFGGARLQQSLRGPLSARVDGRLLLDATGRESRWNLAPALVAALGDRVEVEGGYRFGNLNDPDFAQQGGRGFYATMGVRFTESVLSSAADFWRERIARDQ